MLLASIDDEPVGCVALRRIDATRCETKRMFELRRWLVFMELVLRP
ncbi:MAG: hypothetical protein ABW328_19720 [Ilumatobacteraceae bacterium]